MFSAQTQINPGTKRVFGKNMYENIIMFVRKVVGFFLIFQVDPSLFLRTVQNKKKQVTAVYLFGRRDISEDKFEEAASMVSKIIVIKHTVL